MVEKFLYFYTVQEILMREAMIWYFAVSYELLGEKVCGYPTTSSTSENLRSSSKEEGWFQSSLNIGGSISESSGTNLVLFENLEIRILEYKKIQSDIKYSTTNLNSPFLKSRLENTVWKFHDFSITRILCEINFEYYGVSKSAIVPHLGTLNSDLYEFVHLLKAEIH